MVWAALWHMVSATRPTDTVGRTGCVSTTRTSVSWVSDVNTPMPLTPTYRRPAGFTSTSVMFCLVGKPVTGSSCHVPVDSCLRHRPLLDATYSKVGLAGSSRARLMTFPANCGR